MKELIFASNNSNKLEEIRHKISGDIQVHGLKEIGYLKELPETKQTLEGNALQKVQTLHNDLRKNAFADDTGLEIEALEGRPGVYSARYAGPNCTAEDNMLKVLNEMKGIQNRNARFRTVISAILNDEVFYFEGIVDGKITEERSGSEGFGYDPIFIPDGYEITFAEMDMDEKNKISHRARAVEKFVDFLKTYDL